MYTLGRCIEHDPFHFAQIHHHAAVDGIPGGAVAPAAHGDPYVVRLGYRQALQNVVFADAVDDDFWVGLESRVGFLPRVVVIRAGAHHDGATSFASSAATVFQVSAGAAASVVTAASGWAASDRNCATRASLARRAGLLRWAISSDPW